MNNEITVFKQFKTDLAVFKEHNAELSFDFNIPEEEEAGRAHHRKLRKLWNGVEKLKLKTTEVLRDEVADTNAEAKSIQAEVDLIASPFKAQMDAKDAEIQAEIDAIAAAAEAKKAKEESDKLAEFNRKQKELDDKLAVLNAEADARKTAQEAEEAEKLAEVNRLAAIEEGKRQYAAQAKIDAERASQDAENKLQEAIAEEKAKAHREKNDRIAAELAEKNKQDEIDRKEAERVANVAHREDVEQAVINAMKIVIDECLNLGAEKITQEVVDAIISGEIPHLTINY